MINGTSQQIYLRSNRKNTDFYVNNQFAGRDSATFVAKKKKEYMITAKKNGCVDASVSAEKSFDPTSLLGLFIDWGIFSILVVDAAATGAIREFNQTNYVLDPVCNFDDPTPVLMTPVTPSSIDSKVIIIN